MIPPVPGKPSKISWFQPKPVPQQMMPNPNINKMKPPMGMPMQHQPFMYGNNFMQMPPGMPPMTHEQLMKLFPHIGASQQNNKFYTY